MRIVDAEWRACPKPDGQLISLAAGPAKVTAPDPAGDERPGYWKAAWEVLLGSGIIYRRWVSFGRYGLHEEEWECLL